jgi:serine/threonine-protein kinase
MLEIGSLVGGKYKVLSVIGQGGMSTVYLAMNERANKPWAIKEVRKDAVADFRVVRQSLITETDLLKELSHPYLPSIVDVIDEEGRFLIVMDYIEGNTLEKALNLMGAQPQEYVIEWGIQLCDVLEYLHTRKPAIIYRDIKPGNIMLRPDGTITLIDFGTAREFKEQKNSDTSYLGTRGYAAPEQFGGMGQTDARTDIYCLGATLYHLVTGHNPSEPPYEFYPIRYWNQQLSPGLEYIINKCVQSNPDDRYSSCAEVMYDLQHYREIDRGYKKEAKFGVGLFSAIAVLALIFGVMAGAFRTKAVELAKHTYSTNITEAKGMVDETSATDLFTKSIVIDPTNPEAYNEMIDYYLMDDVMTPEEDVMIRQALITSVGNTTAEEKLSSDKAGYGEVAYKLGVAYFYCYNGEGDKMRASVWFDKAIKTGSLSDSKLARAEKLGTITQYYERLVKGNVDVKPSGDKTIDYKQYFEDLCAVADGNVTEEDNAVTALVIYKEIAGQINDNYKKFIDDGVSNDEMSKEIDFIVSHIETDINSGQDNSKRVKELVGETLTTCAHAKTTIETAKGGN